MNMHARFPGLPEADPAPHAHDQIHVPRPIAYMTIALLAFALVSVGIGRRMHMGVTHEAPLAAKTRVAFRFSSPAMDAIVATRADGRRFQLAKANEEIFPRLILRSIANIRLREGVPQTRLLTLAIEPDGQRLLVDGATRRTVRLAAFGPQNQHSFDALLAGVQS